jgi:hypothetical protein
MSTKLSILRVTYMRLLISEYDDLDLFLKRKNSGPENVKVDSYC